MSDTINSYDEGDLVRCDGVFTDANGAAVDPTTVTFYVRDPGLITTSYQYTVGTHVVREAAGTYYTLVDVDEPGRWYYRFEGDGTGQAARESYFNVASSKFV
jgi:hypothetical protein